MQNCWKRYASDRPHFEVILKILNNYLNRLKRSDSFYYSDSESDEELENNVQRQGSGKLPARTPSIREGTIMLICVKWCTHSARGIGLWEWHCQGGVRVAQLLSCFCCRYTEPGSVRQHETSEQFPTSQ